MSYIPDLPWSIIKSYLLTFNRNRATKSAIALKKYCVEYRGLLENDEIMSSTSFWFVYFYGMARYRPHWNYNYNLIPFTP